MLHELNAVGRFVWWLSAALAFMVFCSPAARALDVGLLESEQDFVGEIDTVISATLIRQPLTESPSSITILNRNMIEASGAVELADVLRLVPGIQVSYAQGNQIAVSHHGFGDAFPRNMQVLVDGRSIYLPAFSDLDWLFLGVELEDIQRIEVIRGPNSSLYGSNAVSGVINMITRQPLQDRGTTVRVTAGDLQTRNGVLRHASSAGRLDYRVTLNYQQSEGLPGDINSTNDRRRLGGISFRGNWHPKPNDQIDIQLGYKAGKSGGGAQPTDDPPAHDKDMTSDYQFIKWRRTLQNEADFTWQFNRNNFGSQDHYRDDIAHAFSLPENVVIGLLGSNPEVDFGLYNYRGQRYDTEVQYISPRIGQLRTVTGAGVRLNRLKSESMTNRSDWISEKSARLFANLSYQASDALLFNVGAMTEYIEEQGAYLAPRFNATWLLGDDHSIRLSYARAKRTPALLERYFNTVYKLDDGTPFLTALRTDEIKSETLTSIELGFTGYWLERRLLLDGKLFYEKTSDIIRFVLDNSQTPRGQVLVNDPTLDAHGAEFQLKYEVGPRDFASLQVSKIDSDVRKYRKSLNPDVLRTIKYNIVPGYTISALASKSLPAGFEASAGFYFLSNMAWLGDGDRLKSYNRFDVRLARRWRSGASNLHLEAIVQNLGNSYTTFRNENIFDTRAYIRFTADWR